MNGNLILRSKTMRYAGAIILLIAMVSQVSAQTNCFLAAELKGDAVNTADGVISPGWANITQYSNITAFGTQGYVKFATNRTDLFALIVVQTGFEWIAVQFTDTSSCMKTGDDGWVFHFAADNSMTVEDTLFKGPSMPTPDTQNDLITEDVIANGYHQIEVVRKMNTGDANDQTFGNGTMVNILFATNVDHYDPKTTYTLLVAYYDHTATANGTNQTTTNNPFTSISIPPPPKDWKPTQSAWLTAVLIFIGIFVVAHASIRVFWRPLKHPSRIVDSSFKEPTLKDRWDATFDHKTNGEHK